MPLGIVGTSFQFCAAARLLGPGSTSETYGPGTLPDRRSLRIESEITQTGIDRGAPRVAPCLREARKFRPLPSRARLAGNHTLHANSARRASVQRGNFRDALLPLATAARIYRSRGGGRGGWNVPTAAGSMTREAALLLFNSVRANVSTIHRISFACTQGRIEME